MTDVPLIFDIARGSFVDGPGIRSVVFFKGCPLRCVWCQNPESQSLETETLVFAERCIHCGRCDQGCDSLARREVGHFYAPAELTDILLRDKVYYDTSAGGVTFSGGEPFLFPEYLGDVASRLKDERIHLTVETCGYLDIERVAELCLPFVDLLLYDIKLADPEQHAQYTGKSNDVILRNLRQLLQTPVELIPRIPLVPGYTATEDNLAQIAGLFQQLGITTYRLLPYNPSGLDKWKRLGKPAPRNMSEKPMTLAEETRWANLFAAYMNGVRT